jgi:macrolide-specific efflux system membrane fusion protein
VIAAIAGGIVYKNKSSGGPAYREVKVMKGSLASTILSTGTVSPENRLEIKPPVAGRIEKVLVEEGDKIKKGQVLAWMSSTERAALIDAASSKGPEEVKQWEEMYRPTPVMAPINGTLIARNVESGQTFATTDAILVMSDRLTVKAQVDETDIARIQLKQKAEIVLDAYPGQKIPATVDQIAFDAKTVNNVTTYVVDVLPDKTPDFMRSGMTANVTFQIAAKQDALYIPAEAVKVVDGASVVSVPGEDAHHPVDREITTGLTEGKKVEVLEGLEEGDTVLVPEFRLGSQKEAGKSLFGGPRRPKKGK